MDVREKLVELLTDNLPRCGNLPRWDNPLQLSCDEQVQRIADHLIMNGVTVHEWINSDEMLPEFPCLAIDVNGNHVFIPDGILTIKDKHGEWCINASLAKEVRLIDGTKMDALIWENRIAYWMPIPHPPKGE